LTHDLAAFLEGSLWEPRSERFPNGAERDKGTRRIAWGATARGIVLPDKLVAQIRIPSRDGRAGHPELVPEPILQGAVQAFAAAAGLRRVGRNVLDAQSRQGAADRGDSLPVDCPAVCSACFT
jgi:hypothetical protein